ncbi:MAG: hypothetical protein L3J11_01665 [Draconibacterium sp.]|nr:hypothetical protein [Draconibacterium sp.]
MANKNKGKVVQMLSPENYIRKKARTLPIHECWINTDWGESGMATIIVARRHTNENITFCLYLVDILCLGVKDTIYQFNVHHSEYQDFLEKISETMEMRITDYVLGHNIILAGVEFAEEFGFKPHKDFTSITEYLLEEDTDDIKLIEIECGKNGKPFYMQGLFENDATANKILKQLEHTAGKGNFDFIKEIDHEFEDDLEDDEDEFDDMTFEQKGVEFMQKYKRITKLNDDEYPHFFSLLQSIVDDFIDIDEYNRFYAELLEELTLLKIDHDKIPNELLGIDNDNSQISNEIKQAFLSVFIDEDSLKQKKKRFKVFSKNKGVEAAIDYLDVIITGLGNSRKYESKLKEAAAKYPNYAILQLKWTKNRIHYEEKIELLPHFPCKLKNFFKSRDSIYPWEYFCYLDTFVHLVIAEENFSKLDACKTVLNELDINENEIVVLSTIISLFQVELVAGYFNEQNNLEES